MLSGECIEKIQFTFPNSDSRKLGRFDTQVDVPDISLMTTDQESSTQHDSNPSRWLGGMNGFELRIGIFLVAGMARAESRGRLA